MSEHFKEEEFKCPCCGEVKVDPNLYTLLEAVRASVGSPIKITSGYRCPAHNASLRGSVASSDHIRGTAADISIVNPRDRYLAIKTLLTIGCNRIGVSGAFLHVSCDKENPQNVIWTY